MINAAEFPLCEKIIERINSRFLKGGWLPLYEPELYTVLVSTAKIDEMLEGTAWDLTPNGAGPSFNEIDGKISDYRKLEEDGFEPLVYHQDEKGHHPEKLRLIDELVMFYDLREKSSGADCEYVLIDECGEDIPVVRISKDKAEIDIKYLKEFGAIKKMHILVQFDYWISNQKNLSELGLEPKGIDIFHHPGVIFDYCLGNKNTFPELNGSCSILRGKCLLKCEEEDIRSLWNFKDTRKEVFIVDKDADGNEITSTCNEKELPNPFTRKGNEIFTLTPVFFKREVLRKYYGDPKLFQVKDGGISSEAGWFTHVDIDRNDGLVATTLVDLGRLPYKEQQYWRSFNVAPPLETGLSHTTEQRWFYGEACNASQAPDLMFKDAFSGFNKDWENKFGWPLFLPLARGDEFRWDGLHSMTTEENDTEFHMQLQNLTLITVDSLNESKLTTTVDVSKPEVPNYLKDKDCDKPTDLKGGIAKFELFLLGLGFNDEEVIRLWKNLQNLRSTNVAHRKSNKLDKKTKELYAWCGLDTGTQKKALDFIFSQFVDKFQTIRNFIL